MEYTIVTSYKLLLKMGTDGSKWATAFCKLFPEVDHDTALTWFCNAIEAGYDKGLRDAKASSLEMEREGPL